MRRGAWFVAGAGAGVYAMIRGRRLAEAFTAQGLADRWQALTVGARLFREEVAQGQAEAETELRERFGLMPHGIRELSAAEDPLVSTGSTDEQTGGRDEGSLVSTGSTDNRTQEGQD
jgi:uncharacterized protein DUF6167